MQYLTLSKTGIWQFRFQIPESKRSLFDGRREIKRSLRTNSISVAKIAALELELEVRKTLKNDTTTRQLYQSIASSVKPMAETRKKPKPLEPTPREIFERYLAYKADYVSPKTLMGQKAKCEIVLELLNKKTIRDVRRIDAENIRQDLKFFPVNSKKYQEFKGLNSREIVDLNKTLGRACLSESSIRDYMQKLSSFFEWCLQNEFTDINPFKGIKFRKLAKDSAAKNHYSNKELNRIFSSEIFTKKCFRHNYQYWLPVLAYYTGARLNELCQLYSDDIIQVNDIWCMHIRASHTDQRLKNHNSERIIPLHDSLLTLGFIEFACHPNRARVFDELSNTRDGFGTVPSKWFGRFKKSLGFGRGHDFHSFRHTFATKLKNSQINVDIAAALLGHSSNSISYDRYGKGYDAQVLAKAINTLPDIPI